MFHKHHRALDLRTNLQQLAFQLLLKTVLPRLVQSQNRLVHSSILVQYLFDGDSNSARQEVCSFVIYLANFSLLGHVAYASTHRAPANTHAHRFSMCSTSKINTLPHRKLPFFFPLWSPPPLHLNF